MRIRGKIRVARETTVSSCMLRDSELYLVCVSVCLSVCLSTTILALQATRRLMSDTNIYLKKFFVQCRTVYNNNGKIKEK